MSTWREGLEGECAVGAASTPRESDCAMREARARRGRQVRDRRGCVRSETGNCAACEICVRGCWANARLVDQRAADEVSA